MKSLCRLLLFCAILAGFAGPVSAWGPHPQITQAALDVLGTNHPMATQLGEQFARLTNYCWLPDYRRIPFPQPELDFYADDYLLFPGVTNHFDHICPEVEKTYAPYFARALQALRTENGPNAARWIGSLLHFVQDSGSPPHGARIRGPLHIKMENWVQADRIHLPDYQPRLFGADDASALKAFETRMDELIEFSGQRGRRLLLQVQIGNRPAVEPIVLQSALESARVTADLLHTLASLVEPTPADEATLRGKLASHHAIGLERFPAKIVLSNTTFSTIADLKGQYEFRHLPAGPYHAIAFRPGNTAVHQLVHLAPGETTVANFDLSPAEPPANLVRNGDFQIQWLRAGLPDCWNRTALGWEGEIIPLKPGQRYELRVDFKNRAQVEVLLRWTRKLPYQVPDPGALPKVDSRPLTPADNVLSFTASERMALLQITIRTRAKPRDACERIQLIAIEQ